MEFIFILALIIGGLYLNHRIAKKFEEIVFAKGYGTELKAYYICFWLGLVGYLYVIALPNAKLDNIELKQQKRMLEILAKLGAKSEDDCIEKKNNEDVKTAIT
ncbi:MAG: hypothetical protein J6Q85_02580 [Clostridia bacterium]|nr:hypothetical protein [Clostridia bacterium]